MNATTSGTASKSLIGRAAAMRFIIMLGVVSLFVAWFIGSAALGILYDRSVTAVAVLSLVLQVLDGRARLFMMPAS